MRVVIGYDRDGHKVYRDEGPSRARISWTGSVHGAPIEGKAVPKGEPTSLQAMHKKAKRHLHLGDVE